MMVYRPSSPKTIRTAHHFAFGFAFIALRSLVYYCLLMPSVEMPEDDFALLVEEALDDLPAAIMNHLDNVAIFIENESPCGDPNMLGVYEGVDMIERGEYGFGEMPDHITLFRKPLLAMCESVEELREEIHVTIMHEIAHHYGIDDDALDEMGWG